MGIFRQTSELGPIPAVVMVSGPDERKFVEGLGQSMRAVEVIIRELALSDAPVLLLAEKGAGKEATARRIHQLSVHASESFLVLAGGSLSPEDLRSFQRDGVAGTIYLEEIGSLSSHSQEAFLEMLSYLENDAEDTRAKVRLICGSSEDLEAAVTARRLREDVYYRISGVCLRIPPLRQRKEDIPQLMSHFMSRYGREFRQPVPVLSPETERLLRDYEWPGNIRELEEAARAIVALGNEELAIEGFRGRWARCLSGTGEPVSLKEASRAASRKAERELILRVLDRTRWNRRRAAQELQISYKALLYKLKQIGSREYDIYSKA